MNWSIRGQYWGHVTSVDQSEASIQVMSHVVWIDQSEASIEVTCSELTNQRPWQVMPGVGVRQDGQKVIIDLGQTQPLPRSRQDCLTEKINLIFSCCFNKWNLYCILKQGDDGQVWLKYSPHICLSYQYWPIRGQYWGHMTSQTNQRPVLPQWSALRRFCFPRDCSEMSCRRV